jgi:hypothetical protein
VRRAGAVAFLVVLAGVCARPARAQHPAQQLTRGIRDYQNLEYDSAAAALRAALSGAGLPALADSDRARGLVYLGATEVFRNRRDSAAAVFARLLYLDPRYRIDQLIFPPDVTNLFQRARLGTRAVAVVVPASTPIAAAGDRLVIWLYASSYHPVTVSVAGPGGAQPRTLYDGGLSDSLQLLWDARAADGSPLDTGRYELRVVSRDDEGRVVRAVGVPLSLARLAEDTLPLPPPPADSLFLPERVTSTRGVRGLLLGLGSAAVVVALPSVVAGRAGTGDRFAVAGALSVSGILALVVQGRAQPIRENIAANEAMRRAWQQQLDSVRAANVVRRRNAQLVIRAGAPHAVTATP